MMKKRNVYLYILSGIIFGFLYTLIPMYINVIFTQKIIEYAVDYKLSELVILSLASAFVIIIAEILNSVYENIIKPEFKIKIHSDILSFYIDSLKSVNVKNLNDDHKYNSLKLIEEKAFEQRINMFDNIVNITLQFSTLISLIGFLATQNVFLTIGVILYSIIMYIIGKHINIKNFNFNVKKQELVTEKEVLTNFYLLSEYAEYIRDESINRKVINCFKSVCADLIEENKNFFKRIFPVNTLFSGGSNIIIEYISLLLLGYIKIKKNIISTAQFLAYYRAIDMIISGIDFLSTGVNKLHLNYVYLKHEKIQIKKEDYNQIAEFKSLQLKNISFKADNKIILNDISLNIMKDNKIAIIGENASGKTTLLKIISNILDITSGEVVLNDRYDYARIQCSCYVPAETVFFQWEKIESDFFDSFIIHSGYYNALKIVEKTKLFLKRTMLSEGEKKILMIIRAFSTKNPIIVLDEPFANLDEGWKEIIKDLIFSSLRTVIFSTHDLSCIDQCTATYEIRNHNCKLMGGI